LPATHISSRGFRSHKTTYAGVGLEILEEAGVSDLIEFHSEESQIVLPRLLAEDTRFDLAFIDDALRTASLVAEPRPSVSLGSGRQLLFALAELASVMGGRGRSASETFSWLPSVLERVAMTRPEMDELTTMCRAQHSRLVGMLALYCGDLDVSEDLAQEALVRLCRDWRHVQKLGNREAWLHRVAINLAHSQYRRKTIERRVIGPRRHLASGPLFACTHTFVSSRIHAKGHDCMPARTGSACR
jgi:hypothetical protein